MSEIRCYFSASNQNSDTTTGMDDSDFLHHMYILAIGGHLLAFLATFSLCMCRNCYVPASGQNSKIILRFSDINFIKESINLVIRGRFQLFSSLYR